MNNLPRSLINLTDRSEDAQEISSSRHSGVWLALLLLSWLSITFANAGALAVWSGTTSQFHRTNGAFADVCILDGEWSGSMLSRKHSGQQWLARMRPLDVNDEHRRALAEEMSHDFDDEDDR